LVNRFPPILVFASELMALLGVVVALKSLTSFSTKRVDDILAAITENGNNIAKLVPIIQERVRQRDQKDVVEEYQKAEIAQNNILLIMKNQEDERQLRDQDRRRKLNSEFSGPNYQYPESVTSNLNTREQIIARKM
jgi:hypothetical protein